MNTATRVAGFAVGLVAVFAITLGIGNAVGEVTAPPKEHEMAHDDGHEGVDADDAGRLPGGLMVSQDGYALDLTADRARPGDDVGISFTIDGPDGRPVTAYDVAHEKQLHLIAVRRDFTGFQHVHPVLGADGTWTTELDLSPGQWRIFADFKPTGADAVTLGADLAVTGYYQPAPASAETRTVVVGDYTVSIEGDLEAGADAELTLSITRDGTPVTDLEPYLGAYGHLVALRAGDLAYLHVHPDGAPGDGSTEPGPDVVFYAAVPSPGDYHLYLDFKHDGVVRTAAFVLAAHGEGEHGHE